MSDNFNGLNVQVLDYVNAQNVNNFANVPNINNKQIGVYCMDKNLHHLLDSIVNCPKPIDNNPPKILSVSTPMDNVQFHRDKFEVFLDAKGYAPEEISCTVLPQYIEVIGKKQVNRFDLIGRSMSRKYALPQLIVPEQSRCILTSEGVLVVSAPWKPKNGNCQYIQI